MASRRPTPDGTHLARLAGALVLAMLLAGAAPTRASPVELIWADDFGAAERVKLERWIRDTHAALERLVGPYPMGVSVFLHRRDGAREPVPWANTRRRDDQGVHFHVDPSYPLEALLADWTAPHELSHLILPYVGPRHAWFAEGFASYLQYPVMRELGVLSNEDVRRRYRASFERAERDYDQPDRPFALAASTLRAEGRYPVMYWGGAVYFLQVDQALGARGSSLTAVLRDYLSCCRRNRAPLADLLGDLDRLAGAPLFSRGYERFRSEPGFPRFRDEEVPTRAGSD